MQIHNTSFSPWLPNLKPDSKAKLRLFCIPYAGGSTSIFRTWATHLPETIELCPIQLPGRGTRINEVPFKYLPNLIDAIVRAITPYLDTPFVFFGHSLGGLIAFEICHQLRIERSPLPKHLIISGCAAPNLRIKRSTLSTLPKLAFIDELSLLNGTPKELLINDEMMDLMLPTLRADFSLYESYSYKQRALLECPLTVFGGINDQAINLQQLDAWRDETQNDFSIYQLPGDHFFLHTKEAELLTLILQQLSPLSYKAA